MKKTVSLLFVMLCAGSTVSKSFSLPEDSDVVKPAVSEEKPLGLSVSALVAMNYLHARKAYEKANPSLFGGPSIEEKVFGTNAACWASLHDVKMTVSREHSSEEAVVIIKTDVHGTPEDFLNIAILDNEKKLLKYVLIKAYLAAKSQDMQKDPKKSITAVVIDAQTKVIRPPENLVFKMGNGLFNVRIETDKNSMGMSFITVFSSKEFEELIKEHFIKEKSVVAEKAVKNGWW